MGRVRARTRHPCRTCSTRAFCSMRQRPALRARAFLSACTVACAQAHVCAFTVANKLVIDARALPMYEVTGGPSIRGAESCTRRANPLQRDPNCYIGKCIAQSAARSVMQVTPHASYGFSSGRLHRCHYSTWEACELDETEVATTCVAACAACVPLPSTTFWALPRSTARLRSPRLIKSNQASLGKCRK